MAAAAAAKVDTPSPKAASPLVVPPSVASAPSPVPAPVPAPPAPVAAAAPASPAKAAPAATTTTADVDDDAGDDFLDGEEWGDLPAVPSTTTCRYARGDVVLLCFCRGFVVFLSWF